MTVVRMQLILDRGRGDGRGRGQTGEQGRGRTDEQGRGRDGERDYGRAGGRSTHETILPPLILSTPFVLETSTPPSFTAPHVIPSPEATYLPSHVSLILDATTSDITLPFITLPSHAWPPIDTTMVDLIP